LLCKAIPTLEIQTVAFLINPYAGGTSPTLVVQPYAGGTDAADPYSKINISYIITV